MQLHDDLLTRALSVMHELRAMKDDTLHLPEQHGRVRPILMAIDKAREAMQQKVVHRIWQHSKQHRRGSGQ